MKYLTCKDIVTLTRDLSHMGVILAIHIFWLVHIVSFPNYCQAFLEVSLRCVQFKQALQQKVYMVAVFARTCERHGCSQIC